MKLAVMLDPGHGGYDSGAGANGLLEKDINWKTAVEVKGMLLERGFTAELTRTENECPSLRERAQRAKNWGADILISVHHNAGGGVGFEIYKSVKGVLDDKLATLLADAFKKTGQTPHGQGIYTRTLPDGSDYYGILRFSAALGIPAIISEYAYIDSTDVTHINSDVGISTEAEAIARAVCKLCDVAWELPQPPVLNLKINGVPSGIDIFVKDGVTYAPVKTLVGELGYVVAWDEPAKTVNIRPK